MCETEIKWNNIDRDSVNHAHTWKRVNVECHSVISGTSNDLPLWCNGPISLFFVFLFLDSPSLLSCLFQSALKYSPI